MSDWDYDGHEFVDDFGNPLPMDPDGADDPTNYDHCGDDYDCEDDSWHDADTYTSIGWGTDEDYGHYGYDEDGGAW